MKVSLAGPSMIIIERDDGRQFGLLSRCDAERLRDQLNDVINGIDSEKEAEVFFNTVDVAARDLAIWFKAYVGAKYVDWKSADDLIVGAYRSLNLNRPTHAINTIHAISERFTAKFKEEVSKP